jgi:hypothetical protein
MAQFSSERGVSGSGRELLSIMGFPHFDQEFVAQETFTEALRSDLAGNAFAAPVVYPIILAALACAPLIKAMQITTGVTCPAPSPAKTVTDSLPPDNIEGDDDSDDDSDDSLSLLLATGSLPRQHRDLGMHSQLVAVDMGKYWKIL